MLYFYIGRPYWWECGFAAVQVKAWEMQIEHKLEELGYTLDEFEDYSRFGVVRSYREETLTDVIEDFLDEITCWECGNDIRHGSHSRVDVDRWICKDTVKVNRK